MVLENLDTFLENPYEYAKKLTDEQLEKVLEKLSEAYYNTSEPLVSDEIFDDLSEILKSRNPKSEFFKKVGAEEYDKTKKIKLPYPLFSLDKIKPTNVNDFEIWIKKYNPKEVVASHKLDGMSGLIYRDSEGEIHLYSRGNGIYGREITSIVPYININIENIPKKYAIRGELIISKEKFKKIEDEFKNARNAVSGMLVAKEINKKYLKLIDFVAYSVVYPHLKKKEQMELIEELEMKEVKYEIIKRKDLTVENMIEYFKKEREESEYNIDGIVINEVEREYKVVEKNDPTAFAFKCEYEGQSEITEVEEVEWKVSKHGYIKPTVIFKSVEIGGSEISRATGHNAKFIKDNKINKGALIRIVKSGDVIPYIKNVVKEAQKGSEPRIKHEWNDTGIDYIAVDIDEDTEEEVIVKRLSNTMKVLKSKYFQEGYIRRLVKVGVRDMIDIINIDEEVLQEEIGEEMGPKIYNIFIDSLKSTTLASLMVASNCYGRGMGIKRIEQVIKEIPDILTKDEVEIEARVLDMEGFKDTTTEIFMEGYKKYKRYMKRLETEQDKVDFKYITKPTKKDKVVKQITSEFNEKSVCLTGFRDEIIKDYIEKVGGKIIENVSKNTYMLIVKDKNSTSSKMKKAQEIKVPIMSKEEFYSKYGLNK